VWCVSCNNEYLQVIPKHPTMEEGGSTTTLNDMGLHFANHLIMNLKEFEYFDSCVDEYMR